MIQWLRNNWVVLSNSSAMIATTAVNAGLGFIYWWLTARMFTPVAVGTASAAVAAMTLLGYLAVLGLGTMLMGELPRRPERAPSLIASALLIASLAGGVVGLGFAALSPWLSHELGILAGSLGSAALFAFGVGLAALTNVLDQALIGLLLGKTQFWRNTVFAAAKLALLALASFYLVGQSGLLIYATWIGGILLSLLALLRPALLRGARGIRFERQVLGQLGRTALSHHLLDMTAQASVLLLPIVVVARLSAELNASFYIAWMLAGFVFMVSNALTNVLYTVGAGHPAALAQQMRLTLKLSFLAALGANLVLFFGAPWILAFFGPSYAEQAVWPLRLLALGAFPLLIRHHYIAVCRVRNQLVSTAPAMALAGGVELALAYFGGSVGGLSGLCLGWLLAVTLQATLMSRAVYQGAVVPYAPAARAVTR